MAPGFMRISDARIPGRDRQEVIFSIRTFDWEDFLFSVTDPGLRRMSMRFRCSSTLWSGIISVMDWVLVDASMLSRPDDCDLHALVSYYDRFSSYTCPT